MKLIIWILITVTQVFADEKFQSIYLAGERGQFFQKYYEQDSYLKSLFVSSQNDAKIIILFEPNFEEARNVVSRANPGARILFLFYSKVPSNFTSLASASLSIRLRWLEDSVNYPKDSTPFNLNRFPDKAKLAVQREAWKEFCEPYILAHAKPVAYVAERMGIKR